jgi:hypothetical protein
MLPPIMSAEHTEQWRPVIGHEGIYDVSDLGNIRRSCGGQGSIEGRVLTRKTNPAGYSLVDLSRDDIKRRFMVGRLVAEAFIGLAPSSRSRVRHKNRDKSDDRPENIEWWTSKARPLREKPLRLELPVKPPPSRPFAGRRWLPVPGYEGSYEISDRGDVWSLPRNGKCGRLLRPSRDRAGYMHVGLCRAGVMKNLTVHRLVMAAFVGPCPDGLETRHLDGNPSNNAWPDNLAYGTAEENLADKLRHGTTGRGERNPRHKLTTDDVREIHRRFEVGESKRSLARSFGVTPPMVRNILAGTAWQEVGREFPRVTETAGMA